MRQNTFKISTKWNDVAYLPPLWRHISRHNDGCCSCTHPALMVREHEENRQAPKFVWSVYPWRMICRYQNYMHGITNHHKHIWGGLLKLLLANLSIIKKNHIYTNAKTAAGTPSPLWRTRLPDAGSCSFTQPAIRDNHYSFAPEFTPSWYDYRERMAALDEPCRLTDPGSE